MIFEEYSQIVKDFVHEAGLSLTDSFDDVCRAQDALIAEIVGRGATIAGWKVVNKDGVIILSPIFDFQVFSCMGEKISQQAIRGTELEVCFQLAVPSSVDAVEGVVAALAPLAAVELIRAGIHPSNHLSCDFYFNYGAFVSSKSIAGTLSFEGGGNDYTFSANIDELVAEKKDIVAQGILQCIHRGYGNKDYFFITGTLNGLADVTDSLGENTVINQGEKLICFDVI
ncbi:hypothetical protein [Marinomonas foliarum]|uniref:2-keto-4-pentenoate hydratase n=1 Tax=Marinomonas foliarum TaxID=491950 RepID=A0A369A7S2_9GAMM|nr:hypothetical protein [Marinomonas foliarum]QRV24651.1 hypothetical protein JSY38_03700 [Marinomonas foliarum]RCX03484.1 hypothetical protein DFP77_11222 [Marinomonas foliarum]